MTDIVERLREYDSKGMLGAEFHEAADEIERLRAALERIAAAGEPEVAAAGVKWAARIAREALK